MSDTKRIQSIDFLRGLVMIIMTLDHVRDYFHNQAFQFDPLDMDRTYGVLYLTRWITHFCAPVFVFLSGTSAWLSGQKQTKTQLAGFLFKRGLWLIFAELTIIAFGWFFNPAFKMEIFGVIWAIGFSMMVLAGLIFLPFRWILALSLAIVFGHNLLDSIHIENPGWLKVVWAALHDRGYFEWNGHGFMLFYPVLPWIGVMGLGYCLGKLYQPGFSEVRRRNILFWLGGMSIGLFFIIRLLNFYGDPSPWVSERDMISTLLSVLNTTKYPPSLLFTLMTLGPALLLLAWSEFFETQQIRGFVIIGRVPFFYYILHIYLIHLLACFAAISLGYEFKDMILSTWVNMSEQLKGYGYPLWMIFPLWVAIVGVLFPLCSRYDRYKRRNKHLNWLRYL